MILEKLKGKPFSKRPSNKRIKFNRTTWAFPNHIKSMMVGMLLGVFKKVKELKFKLHQVMISL